MEIELNKVYNESCLATMKRIPDNFVDIVITSPPYNLNKKASGRGTSKQSYEGWYFDDLPEQDYQEWQKEVIRELMRITKGSIFYNHRIRYAWHSRNSYKIPNKIYHPLHWLNEFPIWCEIIWHRGGELQAMRTKDLDLQMSEYIKLVNPINFLTTDLQQFGKYPPQKILIMFALSLTN